MSNSLIDLFFSIRDNPNLNFLSLTSDYYSILKIDISKNPSELSFDFIKKNYKFVSPIFINDSSLSQRPKSSDILIGYIFSSSVDTSLFLRKFK